jgi:hypothetical protein
MSDLAANPALANAIELSGGHFDAANAMRISSPDESGPDGDWLIPYDGASGINDVTGAVMIDAMTGVIDEVTWIDPNDPNQMPYTLAQIDAMFQSQQSGATLNDNAILEPASLMLAAIAAPAICLVATRRRKRRA